MSSSSRALAEPAESAGVPPTPRWEQGGTIPDFTQALQETKQDFIENMGPYVLAGLGPLLVQAPLSVVLIASWSFVAMLAWLAELGITFWSHEQGIAAGADIALAVSWARWIFLTLTFPAAFCAVTVPFQASLLRAVARHQRGLGPLGLEAGFSTLRVNLWATFVASALMLTLIVAGALAFVLPGLIAAALGVWTFSLAALHREGAMRALRWSCRQVVVHPRSHLSLLAILLSLGMLAAMVPLLGQMFLASYYVRVHRKMFGDGDTPTLLVQSPWSA